jgi:hypothetical protein
MLSKHESHQSDSEGQDYGVHERGGTDLIAVHQGYDESGYHGESYYAQKHGQNP